MSRISIADIVRESGLSRATVDRVMHNRDGVHPRTKAQVELVMARLSAALMPDTRHVPIDIALRLDRGMMDEMIGTARKIDNPALFIEDLHQKDDAEVLQIVRTLCQDVTRPLILTVKNTPPMVMELNKARRRGKRIIALISDLAAEARDVFVGINNRAAGETAAFLIGRTYGDRPTLVGFVLGDHTYHCHEDREIGFRSALRAKFPKVVLAAEAIGNDNPQSTYTAVRSMLQKHPGMAAIYNVSGGHAGLAKAIQEVGRTGDIMFICHEVTEITVPLLRNNQLDFVLSQDPRELLGTAIRHAQYVTADNTPSTDLVDFYVHTAFNLPQYAR